jgi:hypothetical protein
VQLFSLAELPSEQSVLLSARVGSLLVVNFTLDDLYVINVTMPLPPSLAWRSCWASHLRPLCMLLSHICHLRGLGHQQKHLHRVSTRAGCAAGL